MKQIKILLMASLLTVGISSCADRGKTERERWVNEQMEQMTLREQIAQLFVIAVHPRQGEVHIERIMAELRDEQIGGIIWGQVTPTRYVHLLNEMQAQVRIPLLVTMDAEWGVQMRIDSVIRFPQQLALGAIQNIDLIYDLGLEIARQCREVGVHVNFAPVVDVNSNPKNPIISMRSFGENRYQVTERAYAIMRGMHDGGILTTLKHFPGHGDTYLDSHLTLPTVAHDRERLEEIELFPFRELIKRGATGVMTAHLIVPELCDLNIPVSQSRAVVHDLLVEEMGFQGLIVTDALEMSGAIYGRDPDRVALYSLMAGNHVLEIPIDVRASISVIEQAVVNGEIELELVQNAVRKVLEAKFDLGLNHGFTPLNPEGIVERLNTPEAYELRMRLAENALTLLVNRNDIMPLNVNAVQAIHHVEIGQGSAFKNHLQEMIGIETISIPADFTQAQLNAATRNLRHAETVIVSFHSSPRRLSFANVPVDQALVDFVHNLARNHNVILAFFENPYAIANFTQPELFAGLIAAYDNSTQAQISTARAIFGELPFLGKLPVTINEFFPESFGIILPRREPERIMMMP